MKKSVTTLSGALLLAVACSINATVYTHTPERDTEFSDNRTLQNAWKLSDEDWRKYQKIMAGSRGQLSPSLEPFIALGSETTDPQERRRYAELYVQAEFQRVERELAFQREVTAAWARLYPNTPPLLDYARTSLPIGEALKQQAAAGRSLHQALVLKQNCRECDLLLGQLIAEIDQTGIPKVLDIYLQDETNETVIRNWVSQNDLPIHWIQSGKLTINGGNEAPKSEAPSRWGQLNNGQWVQLL
jgi:integrating conjugative element protein (TIGR03759 family)